MTTGDSAWRGGWGRLGFSALLAGGIAWLIWHFGDRIGLHTTLLKSLALAGALFLLLMFRHGKTISLAINQGWHRFQAKRKNVLPVDEGRVKQTAPRNVTVDTIRLAMRNLYGRRWGRKTRILLITGSDYSEMVDKAFKSLADELSEYVMSETSKTAQERPKTCGYVVMKGLQKGVEFIGILEANLIKTNIKGLDLQCFAQGCHGIFRSPFQVRFVPEFAGDMLEVALTSDGVNRTVSVEGLESYELVELESISDKLELLRFALQNSNCPSLKNDLIKLLAAEKA